MSTVVVAMSSLLAGCDEFIPAPTISVPENFEPDEEWVCHDRFDFVRLTLANGGAGRHSQQDAAGVKLAADFDAGVGTVEIGDSAARTEHTRFAVEGLDRRWDWCPAQGGEFRCAFVIDPSGDGSYYKFGSGEDRAKASGWFKCNQVKEASPQSRS